MLLDRIQSQLLVVDVQERLLPALHAPSPVVERCAILLQAAHRLGIPATISEQYRKGLGATDARILAVQGDAPLLEKMHFSCADDPAIAARIKNAARPHVVLCGVEAHVCVLQSALGFQATGLSVAVVADAVTSRKTESVALALSRLRHAGVLVVNTEMVVFEWLNIAGAPEFKDLSKLIK